jgi:hypothetical protein
VVGRHIPPASGAEPTELSELEPLEEPELELPDPELLEPLELPEPPEPLEFAPELLELDALASAFCSVFPCVEPPDDAHAIHDDEATAPSAKSRAVLREPIAREDSICVVIPWRT